MKTCADTTNSIITGKLLVLFSGNRRHLSQRPVGGLPLNQPERCVFQPAGPLCQDRANDGTAFQSLRSLRFSPCCEWNTRFGHNRSLPMREPTPSSLSIADHQRSCKAITRLMGVRGMFAQENPAGCRQAVRKDVPSVSSVWTVDEQGPCGWRRRYHR